MIHKDITRKQGGYVRQGIDVIRKALTPLFLLFLCVAASPFQAYAAQPTWPISNDVQTTRQRTINPVAIPGAPEISIADVDEYASLGYSSYQFIIPGVNYGPLLPDGSPVVTPTAVETLVTYFTMSDIHLTDKESTAQALYQGMIGTFGNIDIGRYSPIILSTTQVLDAAVQTINALNSRTQFDFGISLGDDANNNEYNEIRWFIDVMDGKRITPSSGAHRGAGSIDYQRPYQAAGLDKSIQWYQVLGNHDQYWAGSLYANDYLRSTLTGNKVLNIGFTDTGFPSLDERGTYMGVIDGATPYGNVIDYGPAFSPMQTPFVAADQGRHALTTETSPSLNWMKEFFNTTSKPKGHGFTQANIDNDFASYTFEPKSSVPVKVIVLDDTCKKNPYGVQASSYARGCLDQARYDWLVNELERGQTEGKLMIIAAHIPVGPQLNVPDAPVAPGGPPNTTPVTVFLSTCITTSAVIGVPCNHNLLLEGNTTVPPYSVVTDLSLLQTLHNYSNVILWMSGHRHINTVTPQRALSGQGPEFGFWEVETPSLRDFPQEFRTFQIKRNDNNTVSIIITDVDPAVQGTGSPAEKSRGYAIGASRISAGAIGFTDTNPLVYNAELIKPLAAPYTITVDVTGPGTVSMGPYQAATCAASKPCTAAYLPGTQVNLAPTPNSGAAFSGWSTCAGTSTCNMTMASNITVTATFTQNPTAVVAPPYKNFGNVQRGKTAIATFTVKNTTTKGVADLIMGTVAMSATDSGQFTLVSGKDHCSGRTLASGKTCTFQASFKPTLTSTRTGTVTIPSSDPVSPTIIHPTGVGK